ncbi:MAG: response regulator transcription factor [Bacteroidota bacterium]
MKVLIVDDNAQIRLMIRNIILRESTEIFECEDGEEALAAFVIHQPDWILMDVQMKRMDGISASKQIRTAHPDAKIIIVTNYGDEQTKRAASRVGAHSFITKENLYEINNILYNDLSKSQSAE